ncbi:MAG: lipopolysaccharide transport periplasmic protein LptA [Rhodobacteraceae bacterium]|nr:lipopolysaccharide transport periplasmic protein LptA [Paracoccaceae bacterium]
MAQKFILTIALGAMVALSSVSPLNAQGTSIALTSSTYDNTLPVEVTADALNVAQASNTAEFIGNAKAIQGDMRLGADKVIVTYNQEQSAIETVVATGDVVFTNGTEVAEASKAVYRLGSSEVVLTGNVLLLQGPNAISGDTLTLDLNTNKGSMRGHVKTVFVPKTDK